MHPQKLRKLIQFGKDQLGLPYFISLLACWIFSGWIIFNHYSKKTEEVYSTELSSEAASTTYENLSSTKQLFEEMLAQEEAAPKMTHQHLQTLIQKYNSEAVPKIQPDHDPIDIFLSALPKSYRRHFTMVHKSFSIQRASPLSPRVIMYGPDAKVIMTFNAGKETDGKPLDGGNSIEVIEWNASQKTWDFSEMTFDQSNRLRVENNPAKCVMCHAGTPKPVNFKNVGLYQGKLKPIFPQYPFWPGFYGSVNDIVASDAPGSRDQIMRNFKATFDQVSGLTFSDTEELFRLRRLLDTNPKYADLIKHEQEVHIKNFSQLMSSLPQRNRYRHLVTLASLYTDKNLSVPQNLKTAPYRRNFEKEYGHYLLRPNFYLSSLLSFYQAQFIAEQIKKSPVFAKIKYSLLARKYNCGNLQEGGLSIAELDPSFDLLYPNLSSQDNRDKQYLLAYQYNLEAAGKGGKPNLPLFSWNLEGNEDIASYHYGNVFSDLNELVLWNLVTSVFPQLTPSQARGAAEDRHYAMPASGYFKKYLDEAGGYVSRMNSTQMTFAMGANSYNGSAMKLKAQPVSKQCDSLIVPAARQEMRDLAIAKHQNQLPSHEYALDPRLYRIEDIIGPERAGTNMVRQACEACHSDQSIPVSQQIKPRINVDWYSDTYFRDLHQNYTRIHSSDKTPVPLKTVINEVLSSMTLPIPYENSMPFGRKPMESFSLRCELMIIENNFRANAVLRGRVFECDRSVDVNSEACRCQKLSLAKDRLYKDLYLDK